MRYEMAPQRCLMCNQPVPFVPFKDPLCNPPCDAQRAAHKKEMRERIRFGT